MKNLPFPLNLVNFVVELFFHWDLKKAFVVTLFALIFLAGHLWLSNEENRDLKNLNQQLRSEKEYLKNENEDLRSKLGVLGTNTEQYTGIQKNLSDFKRDWDLSSFYPITDDVFCPRTSGENNYQRIFYKYTTPLIESYLSLKFRMVDQNSKITNYTQRLVTGLKFEDETFLEFDIPTRDSQVVNFRVSSENGVVIPGGPGKSISSPIKDKSIINLKFRTQYKSDQEITQFVDLDYQSANPDYGNEKKTISYDAQINDSQPKTARSNIFIGSYYGGCIQIIDWNIN